MYPSDAAELLNTAAQAGWSTSAYWFRDNNGHAKLKITVVGDEAFYVGTWRRSGITVGLSLDGAITKHRTQTRSSRHTSVDYIRGGVASVSAYIQRNPRAWVVRALEAVA